MINNSNTNNTCDTVESALSQWGKTSFQPLHPSINKPPTVLFITEHSSGGDDAFFAHASATEAIQSTARKPYEARSRLLNRGDSGHPKHTASAIVANSYTHVIALIHRYITCRQEAKCRHIHTMITLTLCCISE